MAALLQTKPALTKISSDSCGAQVSNERYALQNFIFINSEQIQMQNFIKVQIFLHCLVNST